MKMTFVIRSFPGKVTQYTCAKSPDAVQCNHGTENRCREEVSAKTEDRFAIGLKSRCKSGLQPILGPDVYPLS